MHCCARAASVRTALKQRSVGRQQRWKGYTLPPPKWSVTEFLKGETTSEHGQFTSADLQRLATLSYLELPQSEAKESLLKQINSARAFVEAVKDIDTSGVDPMLSPIDTPIETTDGVPSKAFDFTAQMGHSPVLSNTKARNGEFFVVPKNRIDSLMRGQGRRVSFVVADEFGVCGGISCSLPSRAPHSMSSLSLVVKYNKEKLLLDVQDDITVGEVKKELQARTRIPVHGQKILGLRPKAGDDAVLADVMVKKGMLMLIGIPAPEAPTPPVYPPQDAQSAIESLDTVQTDTEPTGWMTRKRQKIDSVPLCQLPIAGTHNSASYSITVSSPLAPDGNAYKSLSTSLAFLGSSVHGVVEKLSANWSVCQNTTVLEQLRDGIRYLDLRVCEYETKYYMCHNKLGCLMHEVLSDINTFIAEEPGEVVIVDFQHAHSIMNLMRLHDEIVSALSADRIAPSTDFSPQSNMGEFFNAKKNLVLLCDALKQSPYFWGKSRIQRRWADQPKAADVVKYLNQTTPGDSKPSPWIKSDTPRPLVVEQFVVTPNQSVVVSAALTGATLHDLARTSNATFAKEWLSREEEQGTEGQCIAIVDYYQESEIMDYVNERLSRLHTEE